MNERNLMSPGNAGAVVYPLHCRSRGNRKDGPALLDDGTDVEPAQSMGKIIGRSRAMQHVYHMIGRVAPTNASVMVTGESGCGKELVAQTVHALSSRALKPFVAVNCGALPPNLIEAELFGYDRGSFTGALKAHRGHFERADGGTLFLDEISEMPADTQVKLLRVLEGGDFFHVGGERPFKADVRVIAATNRLPDEAIRAGILREDLFYRLAVFPIELPLLRERDDDIALLAYHFLRQQNRDHGTEKIFSDAFVQRLGTYSWPGNVRELQNCVFRAFILADRVLDIPEIAPPKPAARTGAHGKLEFMVGTSLADMERDTIFATLERCQGNKRRTAEMLGVSLKTLYNRLNEYEKSDEAGAGERTFARA